MEVCWAMCECHWSSMPGDDYNSASETLWWTWGISQGFLSACWAGPANTEVDTRLGYPHKINKTEFLKEHIHAKNNTSDFWSLGQNCTPRMWPESYPTLMTIEALVRARLGLCISHRSWKGEQRGYVGRKALEASGGACREGWGHTGSLRKVRVYQKGLATLARQIHT